MKDQISINSNDLNITSTALFAVLGNMEFEKLLILGGSIVTIVAMLMCCCRTNVQTVEGNTFTSATIDSNPAKNGFFGSNVQQNVRNNRGSGTLRVTQDGLTRRR